MGVDGGGEKRGQYIDLNQKRKERGLPEIKPEDVQKALRIFSEKTVLEFEQQYEIDDPLVRNRLKDANNYSDHDIETLLTRAVRRMEDYNEILLYAICKIYRERMRRRREEGHPDV